MLLPRFDFYLLLKFYVYIYIYIYTHVHIQEYARIYMHIYKYTVCPYIHTVCLYLRLLTDTRVHSYTNKYISTYSLNIYSYVYKYAPTYKLGVYLHICMQIRLHIHPDIYAVHTYTFFTCTIKPTGSYIHAYIHIRYTYTYTNLYR